MNEECKDRMTIGGDTVWWHFECQEKPHESGLHRWEGKADDGRGVRVYWGSK